jgi:hypothetical protein
VLVALNRADKLGPADRGADLRYCRLHIKDGKVRPLHLDPVFLEQVPGLRPGSKEELLKAQPKLAVTMKAISASDLVSSPPAAAQLRHQRPLTSNEFGELRQKVAELEAEAKEQAAALAAAEQALSRSVPALSFSYLVSDGAESCSTLTNIDSVGLEKLVLTLQACCGDKAYKAMEASQTSKVRFEDALCMVLIYIKSAPSHGELARMFGAFQGLSLARRKKGVSAVLRCARVVARDVLDHTVALPVSRTECLDSRRRSKWFKGPDYEAFADVGQVDDATTCPSETPNSVPAKFQLYSSYKHYNGYKFNMTIGADLLPKWVSICFGARASDPRIQEHPSSRWLARAATPGTDSMGDRGTGADHLASVNGGSYFEPAFLHQGALTPTEVEASEGIAQARSHVERVIGMVRRCRLLRLPLSVENFKAMDCYVFIATMCLHFRNFSKEAQAVIEGGEA